MLRGNELGIELIKCKNKEGTSELREIHCRINDIMYHYNKRFISGADAKDLFSELTQYGIQLNELDVPDKARAKKNEILNTLRSSCKKLKEYCQRFSWQPSDGEQINTTIRYTVRELVKAKKDGELETDPIKYLEWIRKIRVNMVESSRMKSIDTNALYDFNQELIDIIKSRYEIKNDE